MQKGKYVLRSTYQKVFEENKRLIADIETLTANETIPSFKKIGDYIH